MELKQLTLLQIPITLKGGSHWVTRCLEIAHIHGSGNTPNESTIAFQQSYKTFKEQLVINSEAIQEKQKKIIELAKSTKLFIEEHEIGLPVLLIQFSNSKEVEGIWESLK